MEQCTIVQDGQVEATAVPRDERGCISIQSTEEASDQFRFPGIAFTHGADEKTSVRAPNRHRDRHDAMQMVSEEVAATHLPPSLHHRLGDRSIVQISQVEQAAPPVYIRNRLDVENENVHQEPPVGSTRLASIRWRNPATSTLTPAAAVIHPPSSRGAVDPSPCESAANVRFPLRMTVCSRNFPVECIAIGILGGHQCL